jgi:FtsP/CotA-like multicopper oxidase with cupredoxin domain
MAFRFGDPGGSTYNSVGKVADLIRWWEGDTPTNKCINSSGTFITFPCGHRIELKFPGEGDYDWDRDPDCPTCNPGVGFDVDYRPKGDDEWRKVTLLMFAV